MDLEWLDILKVVEIVENASQIILQIYHDYESLVDIELKKDNSPLTIADTKANEYICTNLKSLYPQIPIISEENKNEDYKNRRKWSYAWLIDPLDGTKEFIKRNGQFTVNVGLILRGKPIAGVVNIPVEGKTYYAVKGRGAYCHQTGKKSYNLNRFSEDIHSEKIRVIASSSHMNNETNEFIGKIPNHELMSVGSSIKLLWVALNKVDIYPRIAPTSEWDTCAAHAIVNEMGGKVLIYPKQDEEMSYNKENLLNPYFVVYRSLKYKVE